MRFKKLIEIMFYISGLVGTIIMVILNNIPLVLSNSPFWNYLDHFFYFVFGFFISSSIVFYRNRIRVV